MFKWKEIFKEIHTKMNKISLHYIFTFCDQTRPNVHCKGKMIKEMNKQHLKNK